MAKAVRIKSELKTNKNKAFRQTAFAFFFMLLFLVAGIVTFFAVLLKKMTLHIAFPCMFIGISLILLVLYFVSKRNYKILNAGVRGENKTYDVLKKLPKDYTVITNPVIHHRGFENELDFVVVGAKGVFIVESKNYSGIIIGKTSDNTWKQIKHSKDKVHEKEVKNPSKQASRQGGRMRELFADFDISAEVFSILYFVDNRSELKITDDAEIGVRIINNENDLIDYILKTEGKYKIDDSERTKIIRCFKK